MRFALCSAQADVLLYIYVCAHKEKGVRAMVVVVVLPCVVARRGGNKRFYTQRAYNYCGASERAMPIQKAAACTHFKDQVA